MDFNDWIKDREERQSKLVALRRWAWNQEYGHNKKGSPPIADGDPDRDWLMSQLDRLGPLDPNHHGG